MFASSKNIEQRANDYATARHIELKHRLGFGKDGTVYSTNTATAIKSFVSGFAYEQELACYLRLLEHGVDDVLGHHVPQLIDWEDNLWVIEMTLVQPPFLLDFAGARLDFSPDFPPEVIEQWMADKRQEFGTHWPDVLAILDALAQRFGIHMLDVNPGNITFGDEDPLTHLRGQP